MKYFLLLLIGCWCAPSVARAQRILFEKDSLTQVFAKARRQNKPVFVLLAPPPATASLPPALLKSRNESGLNSPAVVAQLNKGFLNKELAFGTAESAAVVRQYTVTSYPTYLYFGPDGSLLYRRLGNTSAEQRYLSDVQAAQQALADPQNLSYFQAQYQQGNRAGDFLKQYITKRRQLGQLVDPGLLDAYVQQLPVSALDRAAEVVFILENGPLVGSKAHQLTRLNQKVYDSLYRALPLPQRQAINKAIITNTMAQAIATNDRALAAKAAEFARASWTNNYSRGMVAYESNMLNFYRSTKDTTNYLRQAVAYYDRNYFNIPADSVQKGLAALRAFRRAQADNRKRMEQAASAPPVAPSGAAPVGGVSTVQRVAIGPPPALFLQELNNGAWAIYQTGTRNGQYLWRAAQWSKRTIDLDPASYNHDTLAHLLYRLRLYSEAEAMQRQAIALARQEKAPAAAFERELDKIRKRTL